MTPEISNLRYFVLCKSSQAFFETIAGFDCKPPAIGYLTDCINAPGNRFEYRLVDAEGRDVLWRERA